MGIQFLARAQWSGRLNANILDSGSFYFIDRSTEMVTNC